MSDGTETGNISVTAATESYIGVMRLYRKNRGTWSVISTEGDDDSAGTGWSVEGSIWTVANGDMIICASSVNGNIGASAPTSPTLTMTGLSGSPVSMGNTLYRTSALSFDSSMHIVDALVQEKARVSEKLGAAIYGLLRGDATAALENLDTVKRVQRTELREFLSAVGARLLIRQVDGVLELSARAKA